MSQVTMFLNEMRCYIEWNVSYYPGTQWANLRLCKMNRKQIKSLIRNMLKAHWYAVPHTNGYGEEYHVLSVNYGICARKLSDLQMIRWVYAEWRGEQK